MTATGRIRVLIVDDSAVMRSLLRSVLLSDPGLEVAGTAADGASALEILRLQRPDLIVLDVEMPVMDGLVTLRELRARNHTMPVIMCSSLTQRGATVTIEALASGASDYVAKPSGQEGRESAIRTANAGQAVGARYRCLHRRPSGARRAPPGVALRLSASRSHRAAHARSLYAVARGTSQPPLRFAGF